MSNSDRSNGSENLGQPQNHRVKHISIPAWGFWAVVLVSFTNVFIFVVVGLWMLRPDSAPVEMTTDVVLGLHLQLFEAFLAALGIGLAFFGFVGYQTIQAAAERKAEETVRSYQGMGAPLTAQAVATPAVESPNLGGLSTETQTTAVEEDGKL